MKFKLFLILSCLCVHFTTSADEPTTDVEMSESRNLIKLMNDAAETGQHKKVNEEFREKYGQHQIEFTNIWENKEFPLISNGIISVDFDLALPFLKAFAESIKILSIDYRSLSVERQTVIGNLINTRCADTLEVLRMQMGSAAGGNFDGMEIPFKKVERVAIEGHWRKKPSGFPTNELLPEMQVLNLTGDFNNEILNHHYWKLVELNINRPVSNNLKRLIQRNPQIKQLRIEDTMPFTFLQFVNEKVPNLETIAFNVPSDLANHQELRVEFEHVNDLTVTDFNNLLQNEKFSFKNLKRFDLLVNGNIKDEWINFIGSNKDLESLTITSGVFNDATLLSLSKKFNSLLEAKINCDKAVGVDSIADFMESNQHLKKITLNLERDSTAYYKDLAKRLEKQWKITPIDKSLSTLFATKLEPYVEPAKDEGNLQPVINTENPQGDSTNRPTATGAGSPDDLGVPPPVPRPVKPQDQTNSPLDSQNPEDSTSEPPEIDGKPDAAVVCVLSAKLLFFSILSVATIALFI